MLNLSAPGAATRRSTVLLVAALTAFAGACLLAGAAACLALGLPAPDGLEPIMLACAAAAAAVALVGIGLLLALRERTVRGEETRRTSRAERIQHELDLLGLTPKEMTVARLVLQHRSYEEIGKQCRLAPRTVQFHASNIYHKAYVTRRRDFERLMLADAFEAAGAPYERIPRLRPAAPAATTATAPNGGSAVIGSPAGPAPASATPAGANDSASAPSVAAAPSVATAPSAPKVMVGQTIIRPRNATAESR